MAEPAPTDEGLVDGIDTCNAGAVGWHAGMVVVAAPPAVLTPDEALRHAAWLVAIAEPFAARPFVEVLAAVSRT